MPGSKGSEGINSTTISESSYVLSICRLPSTVLRALCIILFHAYNPCLGPIGSILPLRKLRLNSLGDLSIAIESRACEGLHGPLVLPPG
jgi:hypothetical protein